MVMPQIKDSKNFLAAAGADKEDGRRPTIVSAPAAASPELVDRPPVIRVWTPRGMQGLFLWVHACGQALSCVRPHEAADYDEGARV